MILSSRRFLIDLKKWNQGFIFLLIEARVMQLLFAPFLHFCNKEMKKITLFSMSFAIPNLSFNPTISCSCMIMHLYAF